MGSTDSSVLHSSVMAQFYPGTDRIKISHCLQLHLHMLCSMGKNLCFGVSQVPSQ